MHSNKFAMAENKKIEFFCNQQYPDHVNMNNIIGIWKKNE